jgi:hypothetical protein
MSRAHERRTGGRPQPSGPLLTTLFAGPPCLGYQLGVLFDAPRTRATESAGAGH